MNTLYRLSLSLVIVLLISGCSSIQNSIGPDKIQSDLRESVEAPIELTEGQAPFCLVPDLVVAEPQKIVRIPEPYNAKLYFLLDQTIFTPESEVESKEVYDEIVTRNPRQVIISGHTDTSASNEYNDTLSQRRSERVKQDLINLGVSTDVIRISSEGEYRLLVSTPDDTVEVMNRRVEIDLR